MREILFRGKRVDNGEWVEGYYVYVAEEYHYILTGKLDIYKGNVQFEMDMVIPETVGQYTGMEIKDKKVFDGDIINVFPNDRKMFVFWNEETLAWEIADVGTKPNEINHLINCMSLGEINVELCYENEIKSEVIGNIHDNPELLKEGVER